LNCVECSGVELDGVAHCWREFGVNVEDGVPPIPLRGAWRPRREFVGAFSEGFVPSFQSRDDGVIHILIASLIVKVRTGLIRAGFCPPRRAVFESGVGQTREREESLSLVRRANFLRCKESRCNAVAHAE